MRIAILGQQKFGKSVLEAFTGRGDTVAGVFCAPDKAGAPPDPLRSAAEILGIPVHQLPSLRTAEARPGAVFSAHDALRKVQPKAPFGSWDETAQYHNVVRAFEQNRLDMQQPEIPGLRFGIVELRNSLLPDRRYRLSKAWEAVERIKNVVE